MEKLYLVRKLALVKEIRKFDRKMADTITKLNALRNAVAHSFAPELKRDYRKTNVDLNTSKGIEGFVHDTDVLQHYLIELAFGKKLASFVRGLNN